MISNFLNSVWFEILAAILAIAYLLLALRQDIRCWIAWIISSFMYLFVMLYAGLLMESALQIFYVGMGIYGWMQWDKRSTQDKLSIRRWNKKQHFYAIGSLLCIVVISGYFKCCCPIHRFIHNLGRHSCNINGGKKSFRELDILVCH